MSKVKQDDELPEEYIPTSLRQPEEEKRTQVVYACGYERLKNSYGMFAGPFPTLKEALEVVPKQHEDEDEFAVILRFNLDGTDEVIYKWCHQRWARYRK